MSSCTLYHSKWKELEPHSKENGRIQGGGACCKGHERYIRELLSDLSQPSKLFAKVMSPFL